MMHKLDCVGAHKRCSHHRDEITASEQCGCFYCLEVFAPNTIRGWVDDGNTALCPRCGIDSIIGSQSGYRITREFLETMHEHWFK